MTGFPYRDPKSQGAADFYFAIEATFRHIRDRFGLAALHEYWEGLGRDYQRRVWRRWAEGGLSAVARYWRDFFDREPGAVVDVERSADAVVVRVRECPAIKHLRASGRDVMPEFCQHCGVMGGAAAAEAGLSLRVVGGNGSCVQTVVARGTAEPPDLSAIVSCGEER